MNLIIVDVGWGHDSRRLSLIAKIPDPGQIEDLGRQLQGFAAKTADVAGTLDQVARLTAAQLPVLGTVTLQQPLDYLGSGTRALALGIGLENPRVLFLRRR